MHRFLVFAAALCAALASPAWGRALPAPAVTAPTEANPPVPAGQLSDAVRPVAYRLDLTVDPKAERFSGKTEIDVMLEKPSRTIVLDGRDLAMRRATASFAGKTLTGAWRQADPSGVAVLSFPETLPAGPVTLAFDYGAGFNDSPSGMFHMKVGDDWYSWTQFEAIDARSAFPSFDQPSFKTPFSITLRTPPGLMAVSNAPEVSKVMEGGLEVHRFAPTLPLPTYLVAMMVGPFAVAEGTVPPTPERAKPLPLRIVSTRPNAGKLAFALEGTKRIVALLEAYFGEPFPFPKLDQVTSPIMPGAMENAGADLYRDSLIAMSKNAPISQQREFGIVVSHELAHQWFGDLVTPEWWDDIWLNESFASWMSYRIGNAWRPDLDIGAGAVAQGFAAMDTDSLTVGRPVHQKITANAQIDGAFDSITYGKGSQVITMIASYLGQDRFRDGVRRYLAAHRYGNATSADFFAALAKAGGDPRIVPAMRSFIDQQGVPLLVFSHDGDGFTVTQTRYAPFGVTPPATHWDVPMCVRRGKARLCQLLTQRSARFTIGGSGPLAPNAGGTGYYRFELPKQDWNSLIKRANRLPGGEALAVADSLSASLLAGRASVGQLAALARRLVRNPDSYASDAATDALGHLVNMGLVDSQGRRGWRRFRGRLYGPLLKKYGFDPRAGAYDGENPQRTQRRVEIVDELMGSSREGKVNHKLYRAARDYLDGKHAALDPAWFGPAFDAYVSHDGEDGAKALLDKALASQDPLFRPAALYAIGASGMKSVARWLLYDLHDPRLRPSEKHGLLGDIMVSRATREIGYAWLSQHLDSLIAGRNGIFFASRLPQLFDRFCSVERADELAHSFGARFAGTPGQLEFARAVERVRDCGMLRTARGQEISQEFARLR